MPLPFAAVKQQAPLRQRLLSLLVVNGRLGPMVRARDVVAVRRECAQEILERTLQASACAKRKRRRVPARPLAAAHTAIGKTAVRALGAALRPSNAKLALDNRLHRRLVQTLCKKFRVPILRRAQKTETVFGILGAIGHRAAQAVAQALKRVLDLNA